MKHTTLWALAALLFIFSLPIFGQTPDCQFTFTASTAAPGIAHANKGPQCPSWRFTFYSTGFSAVSIQVEAAPDVAGSPGTWAIVPTAAVSEASCFPTGCTAGNPTVATQAGTFVLRTYFPWIRVNLTTATGTGFVSSYMYGYKGTTASVSASPSGIFGTGPFTLDTIVLGAGAQNIKPSTTLLSALVPYTGATADLNLGTHSIVSPCAAGAIQFTLAGKIGCDPQVTENFQAGLGPDVTIKTSDFLPGLYILSANAFPNPLLMYGAASGTATSQGPTGNHAVLFDFIGEACKAGTPGSCNLKTQTNGLTGYENLVSTCSDFSTGLYCLNELTTLNAKTINEVQVDSAGLFTQKWPQLKATSGQQNTLCISDTGLIVSNSAGCATGLSALVPYTGATGNVALGAHGITGAPFTGDTGAGGTTGLVPAPAAGDAAAGKFLSAGGGYAVPPGGGGGSTLYFGAANGVSAANTTITLGSTPVANSVSIFSNGSILRPGIDYTSAGAVMSAAAYYQVGNITANWATLNSVPGGITLSGSAPAPSLRGTGIQTANAATYVVTWPTGTVSGDLAIIDIGHALAVTTLGGGWSELYNDSGSNWGGAIFSKTLNPADITAGSVVVTTGGAFNGVVTITTFIGGTAGIRETVASRNGTGASTITLSTSAGVVATDVLLMFGSNRAASVDTINLGSQQQVANDGTVSGALYFLSPASPGVNAATFAYATAGSGNMQGIVVVKGI
jgi:hypothetical protein